MAANTTPIYSKQGNITWTPAVISSANLLLNGTGIVTNIFTAGSNGGRVERIRVKAGGTNATTVLRIFINNGSDNAVAANNVLYAEKTITAVTLSTIAASTTFELPDTTDTTAFPVVLPAGYKINVTIGANIATGLHVTAIGSDY